jgi:signal transduction histidine kinase
VVIKQRAEVLRAWYTLKSELFFLFLASVIAIFLVVFKLTDVLVRRMRECDERREAAFREMEHSHKLSSLGRLAAGVAHEINNPIGFISSNLSTLQGYIHDIQAMLACYREMTRVFNESITQKKMDPRLPRMLKQSAQLEAEYQIDFLIKDAEELTGECRAGADRIKNIVHEMRYFAHPDHQAISSCGIATIVAEAVQPFRAQLPEGISIEIALDGLPEIECNAPHLRQAFANIFKNAIEALDGQGRIVVEGRCENGELIVKVADTGRGISPENLGKLFDPFFTTKAVGQGVGLGLTTALNIVRMHNGSIAAESTPGAMTTLTICLPLREAASP